MPLRMLMDAGVVIHAEFAEPAVKELPESAVRWSDGSVLGISGLTRKQPDENADYQRQKDALFTVGRLIRERKIEAYTYSEIDIEKLRGRPVVQEFNASQVRTPHRALTISAHVGLHGLFRKGWQEGSRSRTCRAG